MLFDIKCIYEGKEIIAKVDEYEVSHIANEIVWENLKQLVCGTFDNLYPKAKDLLGEKYEIVVSTTVKEVKSYMCGDRLSVDEVSEEMIDEIIRELYYPFAEIRYDFYDENEKCITIDTWKTDDDNEEGIVVAKVYKDKVEFVQSESEYHIDVLEAIEKAKEEIQNK